MRDSSQWGLHRNQKNSSFITMRQAEALLPAEVWTLSNSLISGLIQNHYEHGPPELASIAGNMLERYCAQYDTGYPLPLYLGFSICCHGYLINFTEAIFATDQKIIATLLWDNIFKNRQTEVWETYVPLGESRAGEWLESDYAEESRLGGCGVGRGGLKLICEVLRGDIRVTTLRPYIQLIMGLIAWLLPSYPIKLGFSKSSVWSVENKNLDLTRRYVRSSGCPQAVVRIRLWFFNFWIFGRGYAQRWGKSDSWPELLKSGEGGRVGAVCRWRLNGGCVLLNSGLLSTRLFVFPLFPGISPGMITRHPREAPGLCLSRGTTKASIKSMLEKIWKILPTLMSSSCMQTACSTPHVLMYVNVINNWIIIITLLVSKGVLGRGEKWPSQSIFNEGPNVLPQLLQWLGKHKCHWSLVLPLAAATVHLIKKPQRT